MFRRELYIKKLEMYTGKDAVKIITGVRRCGKTTLMKQLIAEMLEGGVPSENIIYINFEGLIYAYFTKEEDLRTMLDEFLRESAGHMYIFLDELQIVENWAAVLKEMMDQYDCEFFVASSNAGIFSTDYARMLDYRYVKIEVFPMTFGEFLEFQTAKSVEKSKEELFKDYRKYGSMPGVYGFENEEDRYEYLRNLYNTILLKDVVQCNKIRDIAHLDKIMEFLLNHIGETFSPKMIKDHVKERGVTISVDTVYSLLEALESSYLISKATRYDIKSDRELETQEKYYICDICMRNAIMGDEAVSEDAWIENILYYELVTRGFETYVGKYGQNQIDFMAVRGEDRTYLNFCMSVEDKVSAKQNFGPLVHIRDNYFKMVLSMDAETMINKGGIINYPVINFLAP